MDEQEADEGDVDFREYVAGPKNIEGHYAHDERGELQEHEDVFSPVFNSNGEHQSRQGHGSSPTGSRPTSVCSNVPQDKSPDSTSHDPIRQELTGLRLVGQPTKILEENSWGYINVMYVHPLLDDGGRRYLWQASNRRPVHLNGYGRHPGRYPVLPGVAHEFRATPNWARWISRPAEAAG